MAEFSSDGEWAWLPWHDPFETITGVAVYRRNIRGAYDRVRYGEPFQLRDGETAVPLLWDERNAIWRPWVED